MVWWSTAWLLRGMRWTQALAECWMLSGAVAVDPPMSGPRYGACSVVIDNEMWVMGGRDDDGNDLATVEVYSPKTNSGGRARR